MSRSAKNPSWRFFSPCLRYFIDLIIMVNIFSMYHWTQSRSRIRHIRTRTKACTVLPLSRDLSMSLTLIISLFTLLCHLLNRVLGYGTHRHAHTLYRYSTVSRSKDLLEFFLAQASRQVCDGTGRRDFSTYEWCSVRANYLERTILL